MQGRSNKQYSDSARMMGLAATAVAILLFIYGLSLLAKDMPSNPDPRPIGPTYNYWIPTAEDEKYLDSLHSIVNETKSNVDTIGNMVDRCLEKLDDIANE